MLLVISSIHILCWRHPGQVPHQLPPRLKNNPAGIATVKSFTNRDPQSATPRDFQKKTFHISHIFHIFHNKFKIHQIFASSRSFSPGIGFTWNFDDLFFRNHILTVKNVEKIWGKWLKISHISHGFAKFCYENAEISHISPIFFGKKSPYFPYFFKKKLGALKTPFPVKMFRCTPPV